jgi:Arc/MetJ family transcription regulator
MTCIDCSIIRCYKVCIIDGDKIMRTTLALDDDLMEKAQALAGPMEKTALVREALKALIQRESAKRLALLGGSEPLLDYVPRRQSEPA